MKERPILFSGPMVRAILEGRKTVTRRVRGLEGLNAGYYKERIEKVECREGVWHFWEKGHGSSALPVFQSRCPYGVPGDQLWVKETHGLRDCQPHGYQQCLVSYQADSVSMLASPGDDPLEPVEFESPKRWRPSIHMPRWASRITLEIVSVWVERLQDISERDAEAEGVLHDQYSFPNSTTPKRTGFKVIWESINGPGAWERNDWVRRIEFRRNKP